METKETVTLWREYWGENGGEGVGSVDFDKEFVEKWVKTYYNEKVSYEEFIEEIYTSEETIMLERELQEVYYQKIAENVLGTTDAETYMNFLLYCVMNNPENEYEDKARKEFVSNWHVDFVGLALK